MAKFSDIKGFVFDLDGVITDTSVFHSQAWHQVADKVGAPWSKELEDGLKGISRMDSLEMILKAGNLSDQYTEDQKIALATEKNTNYLKLVDQMTPDNILPGIKDFLDDIQSHGYLLSLASASKNAPKVLEKLQLTTYFPKIVDPKTLSKGKPDPEIYLKGAELINLKPEQCIGVEDAAAGVESINAAGETSIGIGDKQILKDADINFEDTGEMTLTNIQKQMA
ncbi:beta-phosphoglucomutase [Lentilactobacillus hilgardii]|uniref:beta-phosphoglucomutase n=1 Tax=Lentilactobacillus hilgardii TaxID=1588 RepID=UPI00019C665D|nr:beta-phosphoglucomutase [Lentilactobacillus hilgardii]EEI18419.1 beta-phosphoglucomutase [Lentilactobacillus buchneri ATCC 11577]MCP9333050.1 beta-phosphoglucomutase [Lentilactobacillus hilgardii]MCP9349687.1 beta-phosphoglucomutase [Lentilactobacillus hilgardii]MCP9352555.1 beta-phosphoglucomutase [Lentilactobacillus hilgardii]MCT3396607.1 beta-phosphoglucomutase [Lentilactobacillus hilgardii]